MRNKTFSLGIIFLSLIIFFKKAFQTEFFADDLGFLIKTRIHYLGKFIAFFNPQRGTFYRPLSTEVFYFFIHLLRDNLFLAHLVAFIGFSLGLYFLYKNIFVIFKDKQLSFLATFLYAIHFSHVYQLYWLAAFQEVAMFLFLNLSFYFFLKGKRFVAILFFISALLSKETAIIFPFFVLIYEGWRWRQKKTKAKKLFIDILPYFALFLVFFLIYRSGLSATEKLVNYQPHFSLKLIINNTLWYSLWSLGFSSIFPDYFPHIFGAPIKRFWLFFKDPVFTAYLAFFILYLFAFFVGFVQFAKKTLNKKNFFIGLVLVGCFLVSIAPFTIIIHKWMVRLTLPLIFIILIQAFVINDLLNIKKTKKLAILIIFLFIGFNFFAVKFEEGASTYNLESKIIKRARVIIGQREDELLKTNTLFIKDEKAGGVTWVSSKKLKTTFHDDGFFRFYFPEFGGKIIYNYDQKKIPPKALVIPARIFFLKR